MNTNKANIVYKIGEVADMFGIHPDTLRNWEKDGVIVPERVGKRGDRRYTSEHIKKIQEEGLVTSIVKKTAGKSKDYSQYSKERLIAELNKLKKQKKFGLVWEEKTEDVVEQCKKEAPILKHIKERTIKTDKDSSNNILIEGDNYHALQVLNYTHKGKIDVIYIDPPYNTGARDWKYNNDYVDSEDGYRHSKWISMMENRLKLAKKLLSDRGIMCIAIDHYELFSLGLLCDQLFEEKNRIGIISVEHNAQGRTFSKYLSTTNEYYLIFAKNINKCKINNLPIEESRIEEYHYKDEKSFYKRIPLRKTGFASRRNDRPTQFFPFFYNKKTKRLSLDEISDSVKILPTNKSGEEFVWRISFDNCKILIENKDIEVVLNGSHFNLYKKQRLSVGAKPTTIWRNPKYNASVYGAGLLNSIIKNNSFNFPKSVKAVKDIVKMSSDDSASTILDFFAGSGTTGHAVLELNKEDGGNRQFILCTNNEGKIAEEVTYPRIKKVIKGYKKNGNGEEVKGLGGNLEYLKTEFVNVDNINKVSDKKKLEFTHEAGEMIALKEDCFQEVIKNKHYQVFTNGKDKYVGIYFRENTEKLIELEGRVLDKDKDEVKLYIFSHSGGSDWKNDYEEYENVIVEDIPEPILRVYKSLNN